MENSVEVPQKIKNRTTIWSSNLLLGIYLKEMKSLSQRDICAPMSVIALFTIAKTRKQPKWRMDKENVLYV